MSTDADTSANAIRARIVAAAAQLLAAGGPASVTTRAVARDADVPTSTIFRLFADKDGLLLAVTEAVWSDYVGAKALRARAEKGDPVSALRSAWRNHVAFGLQNPDVFKMLIARDVGTTSPAQVQAYDVLVARLRRLARAGLLKVPVKRAAAIMQAAGGGVVLLLIGQPDDQRDPMLAEYMFDTVLRAVANAEPEPAAGGSVAALLIAVFEVVDELPGLSSAERALMSEWLQRSVKMVANEPAGRRAQN